MDIRFELAKKVNEDLGDFDVEMLNHDETGRYYRVYDVDGASVNLLVGSKHTHYRAGKHVVIEDLDLQDAVEFALANNFKNIFVYQNFEL